MRTIFTPGSGQTKDKLPVFALHACLTSNIVSPVHPDFDCHPVICFLCLSPETTEKMKNQNSVSLMFHAGRRDSLPKSCPQADVTSCFCLFRKVYTGQKSCTRGKGDQRVKEQEDCIVSSSKGG
jgi:hypothetical protein